MTNRKEIRWERQLAAATMPHMDVHDRVMKTIGYTQTAAKPRSRFVRAWMLPALAMIVMIGSGFAYLSVVELFNDSGEKVLAIHDYGGDNIASPITDQEMEYYKSLAQPGETIIIYKAEDNPQKIVSSYTKPVAVYDYSQLRHDVGDLILLPESLPQPYSYTEGFVNMNAQVPTGVIDEIYAAGDTSGQTVTRVVTAEEQEPIGVVMKLERAGEEYMASVLAWGNTEAWYTDLDRHTGADKVTVHGTEGYTATVDDRQELYWRSGNGADALYYNLSTTDLSEAGRQALVELLDAIVMDE